VGSVAVRRGCCLTIRPSRRRFAARLNSGVRRARSLHMGLLCRSSCSSSPKPGQLPEGAREFAGARCQPCGHIVLRASRVAAVQASSLRQLMQRPLCYTWPSGSATSAASGCRFRALLCRRAPLRTFKAGASVFPSLRRAYSRLTVRPSRHRFVASLIGPVAQRSSLRQHPVAVRLNSGVRRHGWRVCSEVRAGVWWSASRFVLRTILVLRPCHSSA
jgi:hypothetical protein